MSEKCLIMTSLALLVCHPSSTIRCFKPKPKPKPSVVSPKREMHKPPPPKNNQNTKPQESLDSHTKRVLSFPRKKEIQLLEELTGGDPTLSVVEAVFRAGWKNGVGYKIQKVFRVNPSEEVYKRFEEYRTMVKSKRTESGVGGDGHEVLRFRGAAITCSLGLDQFSKTCKRRSCGVCRIITGRNYTSDDVATMERLSITLSKTSWRAHRRVEKCSRENTRVAIVVCRVIAGRVALCCNNRNIRVSTEEEIESFDSVEYMDGSEKLMILDSRAILPCFLVLYNL